MSDVVRYFDIPKSSIYQTNKLQDVKLLFASKYFIYIFIAIYILAILLSYPWLQEIFKSSSKDSLSPEFLKWFAMSIISSSYWKDVWWEFGLKRQQDVDYINFKQKMVQQIFVRTLTKFKYEPEVHKHRVE